jgi:hypothetical protein
LSHFPFASPLPPLTLVYILHISRFLHTPLYPVILSSIKIRFSRLIPARCSVIQLNFATSTVVTMYSTALYCTVVCVQGLLAQLIYGPVKPHCHTEYTVD